MPPPFAAAATIAVSVSCAAMPACAASGSGVSPVKLPDPAGFHLFLLVGQSNMAGRGDVEPQDREILPQVLALDSHDTWVPAVDPIHFDKPSAGTGLARSFARAYLADHPGVTVGLIPCACGGSPIAKWRPGEFWEQTNSHPYDDAIRRARLAMAKGTLKGILWHQGEGDSVPGLAEVHRDALAELIARLRRDLAAEHVPFILGQLGRFEGAPWGESTMLVDAGIQAVAANTPLTGFVSSAGLTSKADNIHFDARSLRELGRRYFEAFVPVAKAAASR